MQVFRTRDSVYANEERSSLCHVDTSTCVKCLSRDGVHDFSVYLLVKCIYILLGPSPIKAT